LGPFYEYERWNYVGVSDDLLPENQEDIVGENIKLASYLSFKWKTNFDFDFDFSAYHQARFDELFSSPRLGSSSSIKYNVTEHLGLVFQYQNIYDPKPVVPIDQLYNVILFSIQVSF
jgi:hypothetical protein